jgi:hypothetical protein
MYSVWDVKETERNEKYNGGVGGGASQGIA